MACFYHLTTEGVEGNWLLKKLVVGDGGPGVTLKLDRIEQRIEVMWQCHRHRCSVVHKDCQG